MSQENTSNEQPNIDNTDGILSEGMMTFLAFLPFGVLFLINYLTP